MTYAIVFVLICLVFIVWLIYRDQRNLKLILKEVNRWLDSPKERELRNEISRLHEQLRELKQERKKLKVRLEIKDMDDSLESKGDAE